VTHPPPVAHLRDGSAVAAWVLKANPAVWDIGAHLAAGAPVDRWRLAPSYRCGLVDVGHPVLLWVTRGDPGLAPGFRAVGEVTAPAEDDVGDPDDPLWREEGARRQVRPYVGVRLRVLPAPIGIDEVRADPSLAAMELLRAPRMGSPLHLTPDELEALRSLLPAAARADVD
jgi:hypothetical protein